MPGASPAAVSADVSRARLHVAGRAPAPAASDRAPTASGSRGGDHQRLRGRRALGRGAQNGSRADHMDARLVLLQQRGPPGVARRYRSPTASAAPPTAAAPRLTSAIACAGLPMARSGVSAPKCSRAAWVKPAPPSGSHTAIANGALHRGGAGQQFAPDAAPASAAADAPLCRRQQAADDRGLAPGPIGAALAGLRHLLHHPGAPHQQVVHGVVDPVQFGAQRGEAAGPAILRRRRLLRRRRRGAGGAIGTGGLDIILAGTEPALIAEPGGRANSSRLRRLRPAGARPMQLRDGYVSRPRRHRAHARRHLRGRA